MQLTGNLKTSGRKFCTMKALLGDRWKPGLERSEDTPRSWPLPSVGSEGAVPFGPTCCVSPGEPSRVSRAEVSWCLSQHQAGSELLITRWPSCLPPALRVTSSHALQQTANELTLPDSGPEPAFLVHKMAEVTVSHRTVVKRTRDTLGNDCAKSVV